MAMKFPRHLWTGEWRLESEQAREAAEEEAARRRAAYAAAERERAAAGETAGAPPRTIRLRTVAAVALVAAAIAGGAFAAGALLHDDPNVQPLPAVSGKPVAPDKGESVAGKIYDQASPAVVSIRTDSGSGTGFLIDRKGTLVTNAHVVGGADRVVVKFGTDGRSIDGQVKGADPSSDLAVVTIDPGSAPGTPSRCSSPTRARSAWATPPSRSATRSASTARRPRASCRASGAPSPRPTASRSTRSSRPTRRSTPVTPAARCST